MFLHGLAFDDFISVVVLESQGIFTFRSFKGNLREFVKGGQVFHGNVQMGLKTPIAIVTTRPVKEKQPNKGESVHFASLRFGPYLFSPKPSFPARYSLKNAFFGRTQSLFHQIAKEISQLF
ncbi:MAG: hypothetical protein LAT55_04250, partial [Opitutales bacterium]|nr:hypothetical protein [Opitutales bacterium]